jgi:dipeptidyl aminopeptidase/acylaminoacyl peptidase
VTSHLWLDDHHILWAGLRGMDTVVGLGDVATGRSHEVWSAMGTTGAHQPVVSGVAGADPVVVLERHDSPPALGRLGRDGWHPVLRTDGPGTRFVTARGGSTRAVSWVSRDGTRVQGLLTVPDAGGPHALVVDVHGGPVTAWHDGWLGRDTHAWLLVARGYAVLRPNPRGSTGRGPAYASAVVGDVGGRDVEDVLAGVEHLVGEGTVDPARVGVTGTSYGGYLAAWLPCRSDVFAASVACSPVTDWVSQHLTTNVAELDLRMLVGDPSDGASHYTTRSPLAHVHRISTPMLLTAGLHDLACPPAQAQVLYGALRARGVEAALAVYPEEGHGVRGAEALADQCARLVAWFERFMPPGPT